MHLPAIYGGTMPVCVNLDDLSRILELITQSLRESGPHTLSYLSSYVHTSLYAHTHGHKQPSYAREGMVRKVVWRMLCSRPGMFVMTTQGAPLMGISANTGGPVPIEWRPDDVWDITGRAALSPSPPPQAMGVVRKSTRVRRPPIRLINQTVS